MKKPKSQKTENIFSKYEPNTEDWLKINKIVNPLIEKAVSSKPPEFIILTGQSGSGKTNLRRKRFAEGYVNFDTYEATLWANKEFGENKLPVEWYRLLHETLLRRSIENKKNIVIEIIGEKENKERIDLVVKKMEDVGYEVFICNISCNPVLAHRRHLNSLKNDEDYFPSSFTQHGVWFNLYKVLKIKELTDLAYVTPNLSERNI